MNIKFSIKQPWGQFVLSVILSLLMAVYLVFFEILPDISQTQMIKEQSVVLKARIQRMKESLVHPVPSVPQDLPRKTSSPAPTTQLVGKIRKQGEVYCVFQRNNHIVFSKAGQSPC